MDAKSTEEEVQAQGQEEVQAMLKEAMEEAIEEAKASLAASPAASPAAAAADQTLQEWLGEKIGPEMALACHSHDAKSAVINCGILARFLKENEADIVKEHSVELLFECKVICAGLADFHLYRLRRKAYTYTNRVLFQAEGIGAWLKFKFYSFVYGI